MKPLNPIMAALVAASVGALPPRTLASETAAVAEADLQSPAAAAVGELARLAEGDKKEAMRVAAGKRIAEFIVQSEGGKSFVASGVGLREVEPMAEAWARNAPADSVANLFFVLGPGEADQSGWLSSHAALTHFKNRSIWVSRLRAVDPIAAYTASAKQITLGLIGREVGALIELASRHAAAVVAERRTSRQLEEEVDRRDTTRPPTPGGAGTGLARSVVSASPPATFEQLYIDGAEVRMVHKPGEEPRRISVKIQTVREADGTLVNRLGVYDISDVNRPIGQTFPITVGTVGPFRLNDIDKGTRNYSLEIKTDPATGERQIVFSRPDSADAEGSGAIKGVSIEDLLLRRADVAAGMGSSGRAEIASVGGKEYYVLQQGGKYASVLLMPKDAVDSRSKASARSLDAALYAEVGRRDAEGRTVPIGGRPHLGSVDGKEYHLVQGPGGWQVKDGPGDKPAPPAAAGGAAPGGAAPGGATPTGTAAEAGADVVARATQAREREGYQIDPANNEGIAPELKGRFIVMHKSLGGNPPSYAYLVLVPTNMAPEGRVGYIDIKNDKGETLHKIERVYLAGRHMVVQFDTQTQYLDLDTPQNNSFKVVGIVHMPKPSETDGKPKGQEFTSLSAALLALKKHFSAPDAAISALPERVRANINGSFKMSIGHPDGVLTVLAIEDSSRETWRLWPDVTKTGRASTGGPYSGAAGPGNLYDDKTKGTIHQGGELFPASFQIAPNRVLPRVSLFGGAALYKLEKDGKTSYHAMFAYSGAVAGETKSSATYRTPLFELFNDDYPLPTGGLSAVSGKGLEGMSVESAIDHMKMGSGIMAKSTLEKGVYAVWRESAMVGSENRKISGKNCAGAVFWWGMSEAEAQAACRAEKLP